MKTGKHPTFIVVGGAKCGTTSLYFYLQEHPEIYVPCKDTLFFNPKSMCAAGDADKICSEEEFRSLFDLQAVGKVAASGEVASSYLFCYEEVIPRILETVGDIQIIIMLRNPVERAFSDYMFRKRDLSEARTFAEAIGEELSGAELPFYTRYIGKGMYEKPVKAFLDAFSSVKVCLFDDLKADAAGFMQDAYRFLGVDDSFEPDVNRRYNTSGRPRSQLAQTLLFKSSGWKLKLKDALVKIFSEQKVVRVIESIRQRNLESIAMPEELQSRLREIYREDIAALQALLGRNLEHWLR